MPKLQCKLKIFSHTIGGGGPKINTSLKDSTGFHPIRGGGVVRGGGEGGGYVRYIYVLLYFCMLRTFGLIDLWVREG